MLPLHNLAFRAARPVGRELLRLYDDARYRPLKPSETSQLAKQVSQILEKGYSEAIAKAYPDHQVLTGVGDPHNWPGEEPFWLLHLDGIQLLQKGLPGFAIVVGVFEKRTCQHALVYDPLHDDVFTAATGAGMQAGQRRGRVSDTPELEQAWVCFDRHTRPPENSHFCAHMQLSRCPALELAYLASGRIDALAFTLTPYQFCAAGALMVQEAGGYVTGITQHDFALHSHELVAGGPKCQRQLKTLLAASSAL